MFGLSKCTGPTPPVIAKDLGRRMMQVGPDAPGSPPGQPVAPSPLVPQGSEPRTVSEAATKAAVAGL
eukprot:313264-Alexandrium_andersonii.AAC.1